MAGGEEGTHSPTQLGTNETVEHQPKAQNIGPEFNVGGKVIAVDRLHHPVQKGDTQDAGQGKDGYIQQQEEEFVVDGEQKEEADGGEATEQHRDNGDRGQQIGPVLFYAALRTKEGVEDVQGGDADQQGNKVESGQLDGGGNDLEGLLTIGGTNDPAVEEEATEANGQQGEDFTVQPFVVVDFFQESLPIAQQVQKGAVFLGVLHGLAFARGIFPA